MPPGRAGIASADGVKRYPIFDPAVAAARLSENDQGGTYAIEGVEISADRTAGRTELKGLSGTTGGVLGTGGVTKNGTGTLVLSGDSSYAGGTTVNAGTLQNSAADTDADKASAKLGGLHTVKPDKERADGNPAFYAGSFWETPRVQGYFERGVAPEPDGYRIGLSSSHPAQSEFDFQAGVPFNFNKFTLGGGLSSSQPTQNEFQKFPGHPSTTSLGVVFPNVDLSDLPPLADQTGSAQAPRFSTRIQYGTPRTERRGERRFQGSGNPRLRP